MLESAGTNPIHGQFLFFAHVADLDDWPKEIEIPSEHFLLLLAMDARVAADTVRLFARKVLSQGMVYLLARGPASECAHDVFDEVEVERRDEPPSKYIDGSVVVTVWL